MANHEPGRDRTANRRRAQRREALRRRIQRRRLAALGAAAGILAIALALGVSLGSGSGRGDKQPTQLTGSTEAEASALERNKEMATEQVEALDDVLAYTEFIREGRRSGKRQVALTFDDGPGPYTDQILDILKRHDAPATFFVLGLQLEDFSALTRKAIRQGHAIGSHGYDHSRMAQMLLEQQAAEINRTEAVMRENEIEPPRLFRPPFGSFDHATLELLEDDDALMVLWSIDTDDYLGSAETIVQRALEGVRPGSVILLHDAGGDRSATVAALPKILAGLERRKLEPVTVPQLLIDNPPPRGQRLEQAQAVPPPGQG